MRTFEEIKQGFLTELDKAKNEYSFEEYAHEPADVLLCEVALNTKLTIEQRKELVKLWKKVEKWYS